MPWSCKYETNLKRALFGLLMFLPLFLSACGSLLAVRSTPISPRSDGERNVAALSPPQKYFSVSENRWFEIETTHASCFGKVHFVDKDKGIKGYVGFLTVPQIVIQSDDPEIIFAGETGFHYNLVYSTDGGKSFREDRRSLPGTVSFISVRKGIVRVGLSVGNERGYLEWGVRYYYERKFHDLGRQKRDVAVNGRHAVDFSGNTKDSPERKREPWRTDRDFDAERLIILEAPISKFTGDIGIYHFLYPKGFDYKKLDPENATRLPPEAIKRMVREVDRLEDLELPSPTDPMVSAACDDLDHPPSTDFGQHPEAFFEWFWKTKEEHPGWPTPEMEEKILSYYKAWKEKGNKRFWMPE